MQSLRALIHAPANRGRRLALALLLLAFAMKALLPAGYMISSSAERFITITICSESTGEVKTMQLPIGGTGDHAPPGDDGNSGQPCAFSGLAQHALGGADPLLLALAIGFILLLGFAPAHPPAARPIAHLYPPLRGPPALV